ncbi:MAG: endopeptidase La [Oscillospiraceae bacterium]|jgi:ATP-dependent Lon protease|nr:endopeptidase La [Oscillospiraceae bacterium]
MDMLENTAINMPVLALRGLTIFPGCILSFDVEREISIRALERAMERDQYIFLVAQREIGTGQPGPGDLFPVGTVSVIRQILRVGETSVRVMMEGRSRARLRRLWQTEPYLQGNVEPMAEGRSRISESQLEALLRQTYANFAEYAALAPRLGEEVAAAVMDDRDPGHLADFIAQNIMLRYQDKQAVLEEIRPVPRLRKVNELLAREAEVLSCEQELEGKIRQEMGEVQRDHIIREQIRLLQQELGEDEDSELTEYRNRILERGLDEEVERRLLKEVDRLAKQPYSSAEASVIRNYLDVCLEIPWGEETRERASVAAARRILDRDHFGLEKVKERILEFIAVRQINPAAKGQIICLAGPPGVGKTSIAISVAAALNRKLARLSLGGVRDEADIRGHRRTYIGAMPGRIVNAITQSGSMNPLLLLDEIDKMGGDFRGDPASALLEVLDSEQNHAFRDHFLEIPLDLSRVLFITTANTTSTIPRPLLDRMEVIELTSYTDEEKLQIARRYLLPKQMKEHGVARSALRVTDEALRAVITGYTRESGVRSLERQMGKLCRKTAMCLVSGESKRVRVAPENLEDFLGVRRYLPPVLEQDPVGVVNGLAWTESGGELLEVEVNAMEGAGKLELTGNLGDVMKESAHAALSCIRSRCAQLGIDPEFYKNRDIHIHFPEGAVPKDGPSAGVAITTAVVSALTGRKVRGDVAMTGEVTLRGRVLAIGGLKEKTMAAKRSGIRTVLIPKENRRDLAEIDPVVRESLRFVAAETIDEVLAEALRPAPKEEKQIITAFVPVEQPVQDASLRQ